MRKLVVVALLALGLGWYLRAQTTTTYTIIATGALANCAPVVAGQTQYCFAVEGLAISVKGGPYALVGSAPVLSVNGQTGVVVLPIPSKVVFNPVTPTGTLQ